MKIMAVDIGKRGGYYFSDEEYGEINFISLAYYEKEIKTLIDIYKPNIIVCGSPTRYFNCIKFHFSMLAIIELICEKREITYHTVIDSTCKKAIIGNGKATKEDIMKWSGINNPDISDCKMFKSYMEKIMLKNDTKHSLNCTKL